VFVDGQADPDVAPDGTLLVDDDLLVLVNAWWEQLTCTVPVAARWQIVCDTHTRSGPADATVSVGPRSLVVLVAGAG
jgi:glycogen operon protein